MSLEPDYESTFEATDGNIYEILFHDDNTIEVRKDDQELGTITLEERDFPDRYHIMNLSLSKCRGLGIGTECLRLQREVYGLPITAACHHVSIPLPDGSHLTEDGPGFISKMRDKGLVVRCCTN